MSTESRATTLSMITLFCSCCSVLMSGCAVGPGRSGDRPILDTRTPAYAHHDANVITRAEIIPAEMPSAYDVVVHARRQWIRGRGVTTLGEWREEAPLVYLDGVRYGTCETLKNIASDAVEEMRFLDAPDATTRFGTGHTGGAILVRLRR